MNLIDGIPKRLGELIDGYSAQQNNIGHSNCKVFHLTSRSNRGLYLKIQSVAYGDLLLEKERLGWLQGKLPVPELICFESDNENQFMLISEINGVPSFDLTLRTDLPNLIRELATGLQAIHSLEREKCHFSWSLNEKIKLVQERLSEGNVDVEYLLRHYPNPNLQPLFDEMISLLPDSEDLVICHGDYSMPNVLLLDGKISGFIDLGQLSVADRYVDFVTIRDTLRYNKIPDEYFTVFLEEYGQHKLDDSKFRFYDLLNRFLG